MSFYPEAEKLCRPEGAADHGDSHRARHILGASCLAAELLLADVACLVAAGGDDLPVVVPRKVVGANTVVRVRAPALTGSELRYHAHGFAACGRLTPGIECRPRCCSTRSAHAPSASNGMCLRASANYYPCEARSSSTDELPHLWFPRVPCFAFDAVVVFFS